MAANSKNDYTITAFDAENWWDFLMHEYPDNYECAKQYYTDEDPDLELEGCRPGNFYINDYFVICELPRISAQDGVIKVNDKPVKRYDGYAGWRRKRIEFEKLKQERLLQEWKKEQYKCQDGRCAWCRKRIFLNNTNVHIDHVKPLIYDGTNDLRNLVLTCADCNYHKGARTEGYNSGMYDRVCNVIPSWVKPNRYNICKIPDIKITQRELKEFESRPAVATYNA